MARRRERRIIRWVVTGVGTFSFLITVAVLFLADTRQSLLPHVPALTGLVGAAAPTAAEVAIARVRAIQIGRPVYRHSVVPGGVRSAQEISTIMNRDRVVAAHYAGIEPALMREERTSTTRLAYVSYRLGSNVYWTREPVRIPAGEQVLTNGQKTIRARCGNMIAADPLGPAAENEPPPQDLELLVAPMSLVGAPLAYTPPELPVPTLEVLPLGPAELGDPVAFSDAVPMPPPPPPSGGFVIVPPESPQPVPEPSTLLLIGLGGAVALARIARRKRQP